MEFGYLQIALAAGALIGLGVSLLVWRAFAAQPDLGAALDNISAERVVETREVASSDERDLQDRIGVWAMKNLPIARYTRVPRKELNLLRIPLHRYWGEKVLYVLIGLAAPPIIALFFQIMGQPMPVIIPAAGSLILAGVLFMLPDYNAYDDAKEARKEFARALSAYIELVALERNSGSGPRQAMEVAASVGDSWVFKRIGEELARSRWSGLPPWDALRTLGEDLDLPELSDLADIMRLSGEEGAQIYATLRARSQGMRAAELNHALADANAVAEKMSIPMSMLGLVFMGILIAPPLLRVMTGGGGGPF
ncbi:type II secretion system F family protein [Kribbia dieselivorans]|uniref:type II secretion system F family protein n=1 Tax=Kribbia dieselivorans TaxID=331526 RepID=UPI0008398DA7|nr:type II secretion system F family protein [Kribbia dieselivorans]